MDSLDLQVLRQARDWVREGRCAWLVTVAETWGSAPRPPGALLCRRDDGLVVGSVSGGCVEDGLIDRIRKGERVGRPSTIVYGITKDEAARFGLPCGGTLKLVQEPVLDVSWIDALLERTGWHELVARRVELSSGAVALEPARRGEAFYLAKKSRPSSASPPSTAPTRRTRPGSSPTSCSSSTARPPANAPPSPTSPT